MAKGGIPELLNFKQKGKDMNEFIKVPMGEKLSYCFGDPALTLMYTMTTTLLTYFYTNVVGISVAAVGMIMLLSRVFDGFSDVLMGTILTVPILNMEKRESGSFVWHCLMHWLLFYCLPCRLWGIWEKSYMLLLRITL